MIFNVTETSRQSATPRAGDLASPQPDYASLTPAPIPVGCYARFGKRGLDILGALVLLLVFAPLILAIGLLQIGGSGSIFFSHRRVGRNGAQFGCLKFRTMVPDADRRLAEILESDPVARQEWAESRKLTNDPRITAIGNFLRRSSLDELPQLLNVLRGDMSLVGPRPVTEPELAMYGDTRDSYLSLRPGLTGKWQVSGRNDISYDARVSLDESYAHGYSMTGDLVILMQTVLVVLGATGR